MRAASWLIPAHAGKTCDLTNGFCTLWAHPRSRGENTTGKDVAPGDTGSSPLTRGKHGPLGPSRWVIGLIPAHAGKTRGTVFSPTGNGAHPRSRGENDLIRVAGYLSVGSSPLTRGKQVVTAYNTRTGGLIPAHAGKT